MIAYHIDRTCSLTPSQIIELAPYPHENGSFSFMSKKFFQGNVSHHGFQYLADASLSSLPSTNESIIEYTTELVRQSFFPEMPSRFQSFFALETIEDLLTWKDFLLTPDAKIFEIEFKEEQCVKLDSAFLPNALYSTNTLAFSPSQNFEDAYKYWSMCHTEAPRYELLITPPVTIRNEKHLSISLT